MSTRSKFNYNLIAFLMIVFISFAYFGGYVHNTWQTDMYAQSLYPWTSFKNMFWNGARFAQIIYVKICFLFHHNPATAPGLHVSLALLINIIITYTAWDTLSKNLQLSLSEGYFGILLLFIIILTRINVFQTDILQFGYSATVTYLGDFFALTAALLLYKNSSWKMVPLAGLLLIIASSFMQQTIFWFALWSVVFLAISYLNPQASFVHLILDVLKRIVAYSCAGIWQLFCFGIMLNPHGGRGDLTQFDLKTQLFLIYDLLKQLFYDCMGIQPAYFYLTSLIITTILIAFAIKKISTTFTEILKYATITFLLFNGCFLAILIPCFFDSWLAHRTVSGFSALLPFLIFILFLFLYRFNWSGKKVIYIFLGAEIILHLGVNWFSSSELYRQQVAINAIDSRDVLYYYTAIEDYEKETGHTITKLSWGSDSNPSNILPGTISPKSINDRVMETPWGRRDIIPFLFGRRFEIVDMPPEIWVQYFSNKDWNTVSEEQVVCIDDTAYIVWY